MKPRYALLLILIFSRTMVYCSEKKPFKRVYIGLSVTPSVTYRYLHGNFVPAGNSQSNLQGIIEYSNNHTIPEFGVGVAAKVGINLTHWLAVESGIGYSLIKYRYNSDQFYSPDIWNGINYNPADSFKTQDRETYHYMTVPIGLRFSLGHRKVRGVIAAGADLDFLLKQVANYTYTYPDGTNVSHTITQTTNNFKTFNISPYLGLGLDCYISPSAVMRIMPVAQIQAFKNINTPITEYLWNAGLNVSFLFGL